jgi:hypothetical protein
LPIFELACFDAWLSKKSQAQGKKCQYLNITSQTISAKIMADSSSLHCSFSEGHQPSVAAMKMLADSGTSMGSPPKKHAFGPPLLLSHESEQIDFRTWDLLSLESEGESGKYVLWSTQPGIDLWKYVLLP